MSVALNGATNRKAMLSVLFVFVRSLKLRLFTSQCPGLREIGLIYGHFCLNSLRKLDALYNFILPSVRSSYLAQWDIWH